MNLREHNSATKITPCSVSGTIIFIAVEIRQIFADDGSHGYDPPDSAILESVAQPANCRVKAKLIANIANPAGTGRFDDERPNTDHAVRQWLFHENMASGSKGSKRNRDVKARRVADESNSGAFGKRCLQSWHQADSIACNKIDIRLYSELIGNHMGESTGAPSHNVDRVAPQLPEIAQVTLADGSKSYEESLHRQSNRARMY
jgi:hypothetical protein